MTHTHTQPTEEWGRDIEFFFFTYPTSNYLSNLWALMTVLVLFTYYPFSIGARTESYALSAGGPPDVSGQHLHTFRPEKDIPTMYTRPVPSQPIVIFCFLFFLLSYFLAVLPKLIRGPPRIPVFTRARTREYLLYTIMHECVYIWTAKKKKKLLAFHTILHTVTEEMREKNTRRARTRPYNAVFITPVTIYELLVRTVRVCVLCIG